MANTYPIPAQISEQNRSYLFGDGIFDTVKISNGKLCFAELHYFRLMASLRIARMSIPQWLDQETYEALLLAKAAEIGANNARMRITFFRNEGGRYFPEKSDIGYTVEAQPLSASDFSLNDTPYEVDIYRDFTITAQLLSTIKTTSKLIHITAAIYAQENDWQNCLLLNEHKNIVELVNANIFVRFGSKIVTPPVSEGCQNGIIRKVILTDVALRETYQFEERPVSVFELQQADELFFTNAIQGVGSITKYRKKIYENKAALAVLTRLNELIAL
jgi:branched-chain amino acid aminotransferase